MTFPTIPTVAAGRVLTSVGTTCASGETFPNLSSLTKNAGDLLIAIVYIYDGNSTNAEFSAWGGGFTEFGDFSTTTDLSIGCAYKWSTGSETGTFTVTSSDTSTNDYATVLLSIPGAHPTTPPEAGGYATGTAASADPGTFNPANWDIEDTLWIAVAGCGETNTGAAFTALASAPSGYSDYAESGISADAVGGIEGAVAFLQSAVASVDPGTFTNDTSNTRVGAITIAVRPDPLTRYWVGGTADWDATAGTKWSTSSGGASGAFVPTENDNVFFDVNSGAGTVTTTGTTTCKSQNLDFTGFTGTLAGTGAINGITGNLILGSGMTLTCTGIFWLEGSGSHTITSNGKAISGKILMNGTGTYTLQDNLTQSHATNDFEHSSGTLDLNNFILEAADFSTASGSTRTITFGSGSIKLNGTGTIWSAVATGLTINANTGKIIFTNNSSTDKTFSGGDVTTYPSFENQTQGTGKVIFTGSNTFNVFDIAASGSGDSRIINFTAGTTTTVTEFKNTGGLTHTLTSVTAASHTLSDSSGTNALSNTTISWSTTSGGATWNAFTSNGNVDGGNNSGWNFTEPSGFGGLLSNYRSSLIGGLIIS